MKKNEYNQAKNVKINLKNIPPMKCFCGANIFSKKYNLHYISPILCGDPKGASAEVFMFQCDLCKTLWARATTPDEVNRRYQALNPEQKAKIDEIKIELKKLKGKLQTNVQLLDLPDEKK